MFRSALASSRIAAAPFARVVPTHAVRASFPSFPTLGRRNAGHASESYDEFNQRYLEFFESCPDVFELQRGMNNCYAYDLVPTVEVVEAMINAARKFDDYSTAVRAIESLKFKVEKPSQYDQYLQELSPLMQKLGIMTKEEMFPESWKGSQRW